MKFADIVSIKKNKHLGIFDSGILIEILGEDRANSDQKGSDKY